MPKGQRGNKEAKKPKKAPVPPAPIGGTVTPVPGAAPPGGAKRR